jgi:sigma-B regulation protein RsbU (phosphoserine phosphatase)
MMNTVQFTQGASTLKVGDSLIVYSDGITEAMNEKEEMYEEERLTQLLTTTLGLDTSHMMEAILKSVSEFIGQAEQSDDVSIIVARRKLETG